MSPQERNHTGPRHRNHHGNGNDIRCRGLDGGMKRLSSINILLSMVFLIFMLIAGPTLFIFDTFAQSYGTYIRDLVFWGTWSEAWTDGGNWQNSWTIFYRA